MSFHFGQLIAHLCKRRHVGVGSIVGSSTVSDSEVEDGGRKYCPRGYRCLAEMHAMEALLDGQSIFGAIDQPVTALQTP